MNHVPLMPTKGMYSVTARNVLFIFIYYESTKRKLKTKLNFTPFFFPSSPMFSEAKVVVVGADECETRYAFDALVEDEDSGEWNVFVGQVLDHCQNVELFAQHESSWTRGL
jgi:hypothetical protein